VLADREAAIVSPIAGTTRDRIEAAVVRHGTPWLLTDTAGLADDTADEIERIGVGRARDAMAAADIILWLGDGPAPEGSLAIRSRVDLPDRPTAPDRINVSAVTMAGIDELWEEMARRAAELTPATTDVTMNRRQAQCATSAERALTEASCRDDPLLVAEELRAALRSFDELTGRAAIENVLDDLFGRFCIGK
jgi:tRNA modification GTPase